VVVGGLLVPAAVINDKETVIVYVGDKPEQIVNILLRASEHTVLHYAPSDPTAPVRVLKGTDSREFRERYGGVLRVKDARIVGIIVGSMGLTADLTRDILHRLQTLIRAARKKYYCFVMGRLNEAKLCNFPEVSRSPSRTVYA
jgi:diphthamide biosynthesis protein 2